MLSESGASGPPGRMPAITSNMSDAQPNGTVSRLASRHTKSLGTCTTSCTQIVKYLHKAKAVPYTAPMTTDTSAASLAMKYRLTDHRLKKIISRDDTVDVRTRRFLQFSSNKNIVNVLKEDMDIFLFHFGDHNLLASGINHAT